MPTAPGAILRRQRPRAECGKASELGRRSQGAEEPRAGSRCMGTSTLPLYSGGYGSCSRKIEKPRLPLELRLRIASVPCVPRYCPVPPSTRKVAVS